MLRLSQLSTSIVKMALLVAKVLIINYLLEILGAKGAEDYA